MEKRLSTSIWVSRCPFAHLSRRIANANEFHNSSFRSCIKCVCVCASISFWFVLQYSLVIGCGQFQIRQIGDWWYVSINLGWISMVHIHSKSTDLIPSICTQPYTGCGEYRHTHNNIYWMITVCEWHASGFSVFDCKETTFSAIFQSSSDRSKIIWAIIVCKGGDRIRYFNLIKHIGWYRSKRWSFADQLLWTEWRWWSKIEEKCKHASWVYREKQSRYPRGFGKLIKVIVEYEKENSVQGVGEIEREREEETICESKKQTIQSYHSGMLINKSTTET